MGSLLEPIILFLVLFFPGVYSSGIAGLNTETIPFMVFRELSRTLTYTLPSLALLWYLIAGKTSAPKLKVKLKKGDLISFAAGFPALILIGLGNTILVSLISHSERFATPLRIETPASAVGWVVLVFSCLCSGYLEECYFRYYLLTKLENSSTPQVINILFSAVLFSVCHIYEGPWGFLNALLAGIFLALLFTRYRSLHGIAWAHAAYNLFVYVLSNFQQAA